ncbi:MAG: hypothetical protein R3F46_14130 [bacterium]
MYRILMLLIIIALLAASCGGKDAQTPLPDSSLSGHSPLFEQTSDTTALPADSLLPWESLDADGFVDPATARRSSAINGNSEFQRGVDAFQTAGSTTPSGQALRLDSGSAGSAERSSATYRIPLAGENPALLSTDINLRLRSDATPSEFFISVANYGTGRWDWFGPFTDGRVRLPLSEAATGSYISPLGNAFVSVVAYAGSSFDIVGVALNQFDPANASAPPVPAGLNLSPVNGGLELTWNSVIASDLAGYAVYWSKTSFSNPKSASVRNLGYLEGGTRHLLSGLSGSVFVAVSAVDLSGNESAISPLQSAIVPAGSGPVIEMTTDAASGITGSAIALSASGAGSYDWDLDGDGVYEVTGDATGNQFADTGKAGIIRPAVRASDGGTAVALGAVSLIIASDLPPVAILTANRTSGAIINGETNPLNVSFNGGNSYDDGASLEYSFSPLGNGSFSTPGASPSFNHGYSSSGSYSAMLRLEDSAGQQAFAILPITVKQVTEFSNTQIFPSYSNFSMNKLEIVAGHPAVLFRKSGPTPDDDGLFYTRALDNGGRLWGEPVKLADNTSFGDMFGLAVIAGNPAVVWFRFSDGRVYYRRATSSTGQTLADWNNPAFPISAATAASEEVRLLEVSGNPAAMWSNGTDINYVRATGASGTGDFAGDWADAPFPIVSSGSVGPQPDIAMIDGNPAVAWFKADSNDAAYLRATSSTGASALDWPTSPVLVNGSDDTNGRVNLEQVNSAPGICFFDGSGGSAIRYTRATTSTGTNVADWPTAVTVSAGFGNGSIWCDMAVIGGRPAIAYEDFTASPSTSYRRANDASGSSWGYPMRVGAMSDPNDTMYERIHLQELDGFPAVTAFHGSWGRVVFCKLESEL